MAKFPYLVCAEDPLNFRAATVEAEDALEALELALPHVRLWRAEAQVEGRPFNPRGGVRIIAKSGQFQAVKVQRAG